MPSGGQFRSGRTPDPNALRRDRPSDAATWTHLSASGRAGDPPKWPLPYPTRREKDIWAEEWARPQALMWEAAQQQREVALYVRTLVLAERAKAPITARRLARQQADALGLTIPGLRTLRWIIDVAPSEGKQVATADDHPSASDRIVRLLQGGAA